MSPMRGYSDSVRTYFITNYIETDQTYVLPEFPERPGALRKFLEGIQTEWNISLFHYRNHGSGKLYLVLPNLTLNKISNRRLPSSRSRESARRYPSSSRTVRKIRRVPRETRLPVRRRDK